MNRIDAPAQTVQIRIGDGPWVDITTAVEGFVVPRWRVERKTGVLTSDKVIARVVVPLLNALGVTIPQLFGARRIDFRLFFHKAMSGAMPETTPVFLGRVVELGRLTKLKAGDCLDLVALDRLEAGNELKPSADILTSREPARYDAVIQALAAEMDLTVGGLHGTGFSTTTPYITHHPRPGEADASVQIRGLAWWPAHDLLVCGIYDGIWGYSPATGRSYELAKTPAPFGSTTCQIEALWVDGTDVYGVSLPTADAAVTAKGRIVKADLSGFSPHFPAPPVKYTIYAEPFKRWNAGLARIKSKEVVWRLPEPGGVGDLFIYWGNAIGMAAPEENEYEPGPVVFGSDYFKAFARDFMGPGREYASKNPIMYGRNLFLPERTAVGLEYTDDDLRPAEVTAYRMPGPLAYYIPRSTPDKKGYWVYDIGNYIPHAEKAGKLPSILPAGYYAFITHGAGRQHFQTDDPLPEIVSPFEISFTRVQRRPSVALTSAGNKIITAEDTVDVDTLTDPLGPLAASDTNEFERLYYRDLTTGTKVEVRFGPTKAHSMRLTRMSDTEALVVFAQEAGITGAHNRLEPLTRLVLGRVYKSGSLWMYKRLTTLGGWTANDDPNVYYHYSPTCLAYRNGVAYVGYTRTTQRFQDLTGAPVYRAYVDWEQDAGLYLLNNSMIEVSSYLLDEVKKGDRIRLWPGSDNPMPYAPLPRTVLDVEWFESRLTKITVSPPLDCSDGAAIPSDRIIDYYERDDLLYSKGIEEYDSRYTGDDGFTWGAPTLQREAAAREVRTYFRAFYLSTKTWGAPIDFGRENITEELTAEDDPEEQRATLTLSNSFPDAATVEVKLGDSPVGFTVDTDELYETGDCTLALPRRYAGLEMTVNYSFWDVSQQFTEATAADSAIYYTRGKELRRYLGPSEIYGEVHYKASGTASPLVVPAPATVYGVAEGGGNYIYQLSVNHSLHVGDRSGWAGKGLASCLAEVALALGCVFWVDGAGVIHFVPRGWRRGSITIASEDVLDYQEPGAWQRAAPSVTVNWPGGEETAGVLSSTRITDNESFSAPLVTSAGWANILASHLYTAKGNNASRAEVVLAGLRLDIETGDGLRLGLAGAISPDENSGTVVGIEPQLNFGQAQTRFTLELE